MLIIRKFLSSLINTLNYEVKLIMAECNDLFLKFNGEIELKK